MLQNFLKPYVQYQKPQIAMLKALCLPLAGAVYNFGWRSAVFVAFAMFCCWLAEYLFTRQEGKPASAAVLVTGMLLGLICPPNVPFWQIGIGSFFCVIFAKMAFGGFGRNMFNPAMVGRCFLYISFPAFLAASWYVPFQGGAAGFTAYTTEIRASEIDADIFHIDAVTSATTLAATKRLNAHIAEAKTAGNETEVKKAVDAFENISLQRLFMGNINGSMGETSALLILLAMIWLLYSKVLFVPLLIGPFIGMLLARVLTTALGLEGLPFFRGYVLNLLAGGTLFAIVFMITEPISAPVNNKARWIYSGLIGFLGTIIRSLSAFNAGLMFAILLGNTFGPLIEIGCVEWEKRKKGKS